MEVPLTPMEFARRARRLYAQREAVVDGDFALHLRPNSLIAATAGQMPCKRWASNRGNRVAYIAPNTHSHLEGYYAIPQIGAVIVPINYRLTASDFAYIINHSGCRVVCAHSDYLDALDSIPWTDCPTSSNLWPWKLLQRVNKEGWVDYEATLAAHPAEFAAPDINENDLLSINYTSGTTARPKGVMITHRNAYMNVMGTLAHHALSPQDSYLWTLPMFHANGWTFVWIVTARGAKHVCLRQVEPRAVFRLMAEENVTMFCAAPTILIAIANSPLEWRDGVPRGRAPLYGWCATRCRYY